MEGDIRKRRQKEIYDRQKTREKIITVVALIVVLSIGLTVLGFVVYGLVGLDRGWW